MATISKKIPDLPAASSLSGAEMVPVVQGGVTRRTTVGDIASQFGGGGGGAAVAYVDAGDAASLAAANTHSDTVAAANLVTAKAYADTGDAATLVAAKAYADTVGGAGGVAQSYVDTADANTLASAHSYTDTKAATTLSSAQSYADTVSAAAQTAAQNFATSHDTTTLNSAKAYTDTAIAGVSSASVSYVDSGDASTLSSAKAYADAVGGGSGTFSVGGAALDLAPDFGAWTISLAGGAAGTLTQDSAAAHFAGSNNIAAIFKSIVFKDNTAYDVSFDISNYTSGSVRVLMYGPTAAHGAVSTNFSGNGSKSVTLTTSSAASTINEFRLQATGTSGNNIFDISNVVVKESGVSGITRPMNDKATEIEVSVVDYGADKTGTADSTSAFATAIGSGAKRIHIPAGSYKVTNIVVNKPVELFGDGLENTVINITTTTTHGMQIIGDAALGRSNKIILRNFKLVYTGTGLPTSANWSGIYIQRHVRMDGVYVRGFTNDGIYFAPSDANESTLSKGTIGNAVFFCDLRNVWSKANGRDGCWVRYGANANNFYNCDFSNNKRYGLHQSTDGASTYGNVYIGGQCSYNSNIGYYFESGTNATMYGAYAEYNGSPTNTNTDGYTNTPYDFFFGDVTLRSWFQIGTLLSNDHTTVRLPAFNANVIQVWQGGEKLYGNT